MALSGQGRASVAHKGSLGAVGLGPCGRGGGCVKGLWEGRVRLDGERGQILGSLESLGAEFADRLDWKRQVARTPPRVLV